jgi:hypothetical protein
MKKDNFYDLMFSNVKKEHKNRLEEELKIIEKYELQEEILALYSGFNSLKKEKDIFYIFNTHPLLIFYLLGFINYNPVEKGISLDIINSILENGKLNQLLILNKKKGVDIFKKSFYSSLGNKLKKRKIDIEIKVLSSSYEECLALHMLDRPSFVEAGILKDFLIRSFKKDSLSWFLDSLDKKLEITYGIPIYREQIIEIIKDILDISIYDAIKYSRFICMMKTKEVEKIKNLFINSLKLKNLDKNKRLDLWNNLNKYAPLSMYKFSVLSIVPKDPSYYLNLKFNIVSKYNYMDLLKKQSQDEVVFK